MRLLLLIAFICYHISSAVQASGDRHIRAIPTLDPLHLSWKDRFRFRDPQDQPDIDQIVSQQKDKIALKLYVRELGRLYQKAQDELFIRSLLEPPYEFTDGDASALSEMVFHQRNKIVLEAYTQELGIQLQKAQDQVPTHHVLQVVSNPTYPAVVGRLLPDHLKTDVGITTGEHDGFLSQSNFVHEYRLRHGNQGEGGRSLNRLWRRMDRGSSDSDAQDPSNSRMTGNSAIHEATADGGPDIQFSTTKTSATGKIRSKGFPYNELSFHSNPLFYTDPQSLDQAFKATIRPPIDLNQPGPSNFYGTYYDTGSVQSVQSSRHKGTKSQSSSAESEATSPRSSKFDPKFFNSKVQPPSSPKSESTGGGGQGIRKPGSLRPQSSSILGLLKSDQTMLSLSHWRSDTTKNEAHLRQQKKNNGHSKSQNVTPSSGDTSSVKGFGRKILAKLCCPTKVKKPKQRREEMEGYDMVDHNTRYSPNKIKNEATDLENRVSTRTFPFILSRDLSSTDNIQQGTVTGRNKFSDSQSDDPLPTHHLEARNPMLPVLAPPFEGFEEQAPRPRPVLENHLPLRPPRVNSTPTFSSQESLIWRTHGTTPTNGGGLRNLLLSRTSTDDTLDLVHSNEATYADSSFSWPSSSGKTTPLSKNRQTSWKSDRSWSSLSRSTTRLSESSQVKAKGKETGFVRQRFDGSRPEIPLGQEPHTDEYKAFQRPDSSRDSEKESVKSEGPSKLEHTPDPDSNLNLGRGGLYKAGNSMKHSQPSPSGDNSNLNYLHLPYPSHYKDDVSLHTHSIPSTSNWDPTRLFPPKSQTKLRPKEPEGVLSLLRTHSHAAHSKALISTPNLDVQTRPFTPSTPKTPLSKQSKFNQDHILRSGQGTPRTRIVNAQMGASQRTLLKAEKMENGGNGKEKEGLSTGGSAQGTLALLFESSKGLPRVSQVGGNLVKGGSLGSGGEDGKDGKGRRRRKGMDKGKGKGKGKGKREGTRTRRGIGVEDEKWRRGFWETDLGAGA